jgi:hypothetical protein
MTERRRVHKNKRRKKERARPHIETSGCWWIKSTFVGVFDL